LLRYFFGNGVHHSALLFSLLPMTIGSDSAQQKRAKFLYLAHQ